MELPIEWHEFKLNDLTQLAGGKTPSKTNKQYWDSPDMCWVTPKDMKKTYISNSIDKISALAVDQASMKVFPENSVIFVVRSGILKHSFPVAITTIPVTLNQDLKAISPIDSVTPKFVAHMLQAYSNRILHECSKAGTTVDSIETNLLGNYKFPLPPLAEQKVIADTLDELLAQVDTLKARLDAIPAILKRFRQSVLAAAVTGKLTEEWRREHAIPENSWGIQSANGLCEKVQSGSTPKNNPFDQNGTVPFLKVYNIVNQEIDFEYRPQFITEEVHKTKLKRSIGYPGDVLMNIVGPPLGKVAILPDTYPEWNLNQAITLFRPDPQKLLPKFLYYVLCEGSMVRDVIHDLKGIVGQVNISLTQCREAKIPCPSLPEQTEIVRRVEQLFTYADQVEQQVKNAQTRVNQLTQAILAKAFRGNLTEQWRKDNPELISGENSAEALLERIKAERATQQQKKKPARRKAKS